MALRQAVRENILLSDPSEGIKGITVPEPDREYLELAELQHLSKVEIGGRLGAEVKRAFLFACYCALRISDLKSLKWGDIGHTASGAQIVKWQVKTRSRVVVPLHESAWG
jgi:integrase